MATKNLDPGNVIKQVYQEGTESLQTNVVGSVDITASSPIPVVIGGTGDMSVLASMEIPFSSIPNSGASPFEIVASLGLEAKRFIVYDTTGESMQIRIGASVGTQLFVTGPGQTDSFDIAVLAGTRISIRSNGVAPSAGSYVITILGN